MARMVNFRLAQHTEDQLVDAVETLGLADRTQAVKIAIAMLHEAASADASAVDVNKYMRQIRRAEREEKRNDGAKQSSVRGTGSPKPASKGVRVRTGKSARRSTRQG